MTDRQTDKSKERIFGLYLSPYCSCVTGHGTRAEWDYFESRFWLFLYGNFLGPHTVPEGWLQAENKNVKDWNRGRICRLVDWKQQVQLTYSLLWRFCRIPRYGYRRFWESETVTVLGTGMVEILKGLRTAGRLKLKVLNKKIKVKKFQIRPKCFELVFSEYCRCLDIQQHWIQVFWEFPRIFLRTLKVLLTGSWRKLRDLGLELDGSQGLTHMALRILKTARGLGTDSW